MDKEDREIVDFALQHGCKSLAEAEFALEKLKANEAARLKNEQEQAEDIEKVKHAGEVQHDKLLSYIFAFAQRDRERTAMTINGKRVSYDTNLRGYLCPKCNGRLERRDFEYALEIATGVFPDLLPAPIIRIVTTTEMRKPTTWRGKVKCSWCKKKLAVIVQSR